MNEISSILTTFHNATNIPVAFVHHKTLAFSIPGLDKAIFTDYFIDICLADFYQQGGNQSQAVIFTLAPEYFLGISELSPDTYLLLGPCVPFNHSWKDILRNIKPPLYQDNYLELSKFLFGLQPISESVFRNAFQLLLYSCHKKFIMIKQIFTESFEQSVHPIKPSLTQYIFDAKEGASFHTPQTLEIQITEAIETGNLSMLEQLITQPFHGRLGTLSLNNDRQIRYMFVNTVAVISRAAMRGGVNYENACSMADIYCQKMDLLTNLDEIQRLQFQMLREFCKESEKCNYTVHTPIVQEICDYINKHSHEQISLEDLAKNCHLSPRRLSYKFYQEMNVSIVDYIHSVKLEEAKLLLRYSHHSISEISNYLGYTTQSYFTSIFKKFYKLTPQEYKTTKYSVE